MIPFAETHYVNHKSNILCQCGEILHKIRPPPFLTNDGWPTDNEIKEKMAERMNQIDFKTATTEIKAKIRNKNKIDTLFNTYIRDKTVAFRETVSAYISTIKIIQTEFIEEIKKSEEYKNARKAFLQVSRSMMSFGTKFNLNERETRIHFKTSWQRRRFAYMYSIGTLIKYKFRIRV
jgi:hypothetical protein